MLVLRPVQERDIADLHALSLTTGGGLTTLPPDEAVLAERVAHAVASFASDVDAPNEEYYLFVFEDLETRRVVGTSGIFATVGKSKPFYSYRLLHITQQSHEPEATVHTQLLQLVNDYAGATEIGTLFLDRDYRVGGYGALLSKARYLMMAAYPERFSERVMAEIRGWVDENGQSPVWEAIGRHFFGMDFETADRINGMGNSQFIADLMPKFPIYVNILPESARVAIGRPHDGARGAVKLLVDEGFRFGGAVDIFDAGPCYEAPRDDIRTVRAAREVTLAATGCAEDGGSETLIVAAPRLPDFRVVRSRVTEGGGGEVTLPAEAADALGVAVGNPLMVAPLKAKDDGR